MNETEELINKYELIELLEKGEQVKAMKRVNSDLDLVKSIFKHYDKEALFSKINWSNADLLDVPSLEDSMKGVSHIYHSAALVSFNKRNFKWPYRISLCTF